MRSKKKDFSLIPVYMRPTFQRGGSVWVNNQYPNLADNSQLLQLISTPRNQGFEQGLQNTQTLSDLARLDLSTQQLDLQKQGFDFQKEGFDYQKEQDFLKNQMMQEQLTMQKQENEMNLVNSQMNMLTAVDKVLNVPIPLGDQEALKNMKIEAGLSTEDGESTLNLNDPSSYANYLNKALSFVKSQDVSRMIGTTTLITDMSAKLAEVDKTISTIVSDPNRSMAYNIDGYQDKIQNIKKKLIELGHTPSAESYDKIIQLKDELNGVTLELSNLGNLTIENSELELESKVTNLKKQNEYYEKLQTISNTNYPNEEERNKAINKLNNEYPMLFTDSKGKTTSNNTSSSSSGGSNTLKTMENLIVASIANGSPSEVIDTLIDISNRLDGKVPESQKSQYESNVININDKGVMNVSNTELALKGVSGAPTYKPNSENLKNSLISAGFDPDQLKKSLIGSSFNVLDQTLELSFDNLSWTYPNAFPRKVIQAIIGEDNIEKYRIGKTNRFKINLKDHYDSADSDGDINISNIEKEATEKEVSEALADPHTLANYFSGSVRKQKGNENLGNTDIIKGSYNLLGLSDNNASDFTIEGLVENKRFKEENESNLITGWYGTKDVPDDSEQYVPPLDISLRKLIYSLDGESKNLGFDFTITSLSRSKAEQRKYGNEENSLHLRGNAIDIRYKSDTGEGEDVLEYLKSIGTKINSTKAFEKNKHMIDLGGEDGVFYFYTHVGTAEHIHLYKLNSEKETAESAQHGMTKK